MHIYLDPPIRFLSLHHKKPHPPKTKKMYVYLDPPIKFFSYHGNGETIRLGQEIQCLPYAEFYLLSFLNYIYKFI